MSQAKRLSPAFALIPWALAAYIVFATLGPQHLRPHLPPQMGAQVERFGAYFVLMAAFALAYPTRKPWLAVGGAVAAVLLELGQGLTPDRDPGVQDAIAKACGAVAGVLFVVVAERTWAHWRLRGR
jgi:VanZ family protein